MLYCSAFTGSFDQSWHVVDAQQTCSVNIEGLTGTPSRAIPSLQADLRGHGAALSHSYRNHSSGHFLLSLVSSWCPELVSFQLEGGGGEDPREAPPASLFFERTVRKPALFRDLSVPGKAPSPLYRYLI